MMNEQIKNVKKNGQINNAKGKKEQKKYIFYILYQFVTGMYPPITYYWTVSLILDRL